VPAINAISIDKLARLIGTPTCPAVIDIRTDAEGTADPRSIPGARHRAAGKVAMWAAGFAGQAVLVACNDGGAAGQGVAAWLRQAGARADIVEGGVSAWAAAGQPMVDLAALPRRDAAGRTLWVTRARPKVDRIACPWLIRRFVDPDALFLFVAASDVPGVAERMGATPFDIEGDGVRWTHDGARCTFDVMLEGFGLGGVAPLARLAAIVRGADTGHPEIAPEAAGLLAVSLGLSRMFGDDLEQLGAGMLVYDALYRWCRDATGETHDWTSHRPARAKDRA
jgi:rhodanese-related sulfurtransferase